MRYYNIHVNITHTRVHTCIHTLIHTNFYIYTNTFILTHIHTYIHDPHPTVNTYIRTNKQNLQTTRIRRQVKASHTYILTYVCTYIQSRVCNLYQYLYYLYSYFIYFVSQPDLPRRQVGNVMANVVTSGEQRNSVSYMVSSYIPNTYIQANIRTYIHVYFLIYTHSYKHRNRKAKSPDGRNK